MTTTTLDLARAAALWAALPTKKRTTLLRRVLVNPAGAASYAAASFDGLNHLRAEIARRLLAL